MNMIEKIAKALAAQDIVERETEEEYEEVNKRWGGYVYLARSALYAMRFPTEDMAMFVREHNSGFSNSGEYQLWIEAALADDK